MLNNQRIRILSMIWSKQKYIEFSFKSRACHDWSRCNGICLVSGPDVRVCQQKLDICICIPLHLLQPWKLGFYAEIYIIIFSRESVTYTLFHCLWFFHSDLMLSGIVKPGSAVFSRSHNKLLKNTDVRTPI